MAQANDPIRGPLEAIFREIFQDPQLLLRDDMTAADVAKWDSLSNIRMIVAVEAHFRVKFKNLEIVRLKHVGDLINLIRTRCANLSKAA